MTSPSTGQQPPLVQETPSVAQNDAVDDGASPSTTEQATTPKSQGTYLRILSYGARNNGVFVILLGLLCSVASGVALPLMNIFFGKLFGDFNSYLLPGSTLDEGKFRSMISSSSLYIVYLFIGKFATTYIFMISFRFVSLEASSALRLEYLNALFALPISKLDEISVGAVTNAITSLSNTIQQSVSDRLGVLFQALALLIAAYAIAFRYSWSLTLVVSSAILFVMIGYSITVPFLVKGQSGIDKADEKHASIAADVFGSIRTVFSLGAETPLYRKYSKWIDEARNRGLKMSIVTGFHLAILFFAMYVNFGLALWFGLKQFRDGHIANLNTVITVFFSVLIVVAGLGNIAGPLVAISKAISASGPFFDVIDSEKVTAGGIKEPDVTSQADIEFQDVRFAYPTRPDMPILKGFNARFEKGKTTALVGPSGSGKSTIVALIERWYDLLPSDGKESTDGGQICLDNHNIKELDTRWWRTQIGLVQQEPFLFNDSIYKNVSLGLIGSKWENEAEALKMELVVAACKEAYADEFIQRMPLGYDTIVGEGGMTLSGGQRQRIAIARSIVRQPPILILDEATSSIDVRGEKIVQEALNRVSRDRTTIMIAHRLSTVRKANKIIVMKDGVNLEEGSHEDLILKHGLYYDLVHAQHLEPLSDLSIGDSPSALEKTEDLARQDYSIEEKESLDEPEKGEPQKSIGFFRAMLVFLSEQRSNWILYVLVTASAVGAGAGFALQSWLFANMTQIFQFTGAKLMSSANFWASMFVVLASAMGIFYFVLGFTSNSLSMFMVSAYRKDYFLNIIRNSVPYYDREENSSGSLLSRLSTDPRQLQELFGINGVFPLVSIFSITGCVAISFSFGWKLAAVTFFAAMPFIFFAAFMRLRYEIMFESMNAEVYADSSKFATEAIRAFRTVTSLTMEKSIIERYAGLLKEQRHKALRKAWYATLVFAFSDSVELCAMALALWYGGTLIASHEADIVTFSVVYIAIIQGAQSCGQFLSFGPNIAQTKAAGNRILAARAVLDQQLQSVSAEPLTFSGRDSDASVEIKGVSFSYATRSATTFRNLNIPIESGQFVALVGPSGCGKSTIISLLERFYDPTQGNILFGGRDVRSIDIRSYRRAISLVAQEPKLFDGSIRENILLGLEDEADLTSDENIVQACKDAEIHDFIMSLPEGYSTELGVNAQASLSGGQRQRLCIARALIRKPRLLLLDEATSSLDSQSEKVVQGALERLAAKRSLTIIAVAHRLATIQKADRIFVFGESRVGEGSEIVEQGSHLELLRAKGAYWQMCQAQALDR
ncbi:hypothetical protein FE257_001020 [Aspergillus nanangensis]|uniref:ABC multidrug transporter n=1 Tax=Aspergillus nanangensis TaxID=2582783 RepID=A0AAD4GYH1_ASPNN|nr:hypothetical protein FE257_001020 [Aspergillus nanangensis]